MAGRWVCRLGEPVQNLPGGGVRRVHPQGGIGPVARLGRPPLVEKGGRPGGE
ncbi:MAG: hypothetical protein JWO31_3142, partial [Phycisphaerales bacterium]|nr:hypothetical protein [Phycisphaerales bacterium]